MQEGEKLFGSLSQISVGIPNFSVTLIGISTNKFVGIASRPVMY